MSVALAPKASIWVVTGAAGFIGHRLVEVMQRRGHRVISVDVLHSGNNPFLSRSEHNHVDFGRTMDRDDLVPMFRRGEINPTEVAAVIHLGACTDTLERDELYLDQVNVRFSQELWRLCTNHRVPLIYASSAATYGAGEYGYEDDESILPHLHPLNPYGWSKQRFDMWALGEERTGRAPPAWASLKFFNVYGYGERHKGVMASMVLHAHDQIERDRCVRLFRSHRTGIADGEQRRDFVFVDDVIDAILHLAAQPTVRGIFNIGSGEARSFLDLVRATFGSLGYPERIQFIDLPADLRDKYQYYTVAPVAKLRATGFHQPFTALEEGVDRYIRRLKAFGR